MGCQLHVKGVSEEVRERLQASANRNFRTLNQEALARIQFSFEIEDSLRSKQFQKFVDASLAGTEQSVSSVPLQGIVSKARATGK